MPPKPPPAPRVPRHARLHAGHPRLPGGRDVDGRAKPRYDDARVVSPPAARPTAVDLLVRGCAVVSMDDAGTCISDGAIAIKGSRIHWVGSSREATQRFRAKTVIEAADTIALPGLIDAHFHTAQQLL